MRRKIALVMGGSGGMGSAICRGLSKIDVKVYAAYYKNDIAVNKLAAACGINKVFCDVRDLKSVGKMADDIFKKEDGIDILINAITGALKLKPFGELGAADFREEMETIFFGSINVLKEILPRMEKRSSGVIINILTSIVAEGVLPPARMSSYVAAKSALLGLTKSLASELGRANLSVLGISPYFVETPLLKAFPPKLLEIEREKQPDKKLLQPDDIAELISHIVANPSLYQSGENILIKTRGDIAKRLGTSRRA